MIKIKEFFQSNKLIVKWTIWYFFILWLILKFIFRFDMLSAHYWWRFFHSSLLGFGGLVFGMLVYTALPIYVASIMIMNRTKEPIIKFSLISKIKTLFSKKSEPTPEPEPESQPEPEPIAPEYPNELPPELRVPFMRAKNKLSLTGAVSVYNKQTANQNDIENSELAPQNAIPLPMDFDISSDLPESDTTIPVFKDIDFDTPTSSDEPEKIENTTTKYFDKNNTEYETYKDFIATEKYVIYEHNDEDFWIMDEDTWFAAGKQKDSPIKELVKLATENNLTPIIYLKSQNIMDVDEMIAKFESAGIRVIKNLDEL